MPMIDFRSDTVTCPSGDMRKAMAKAEVGDDVYGEDPSVNELQRLGARLTGKKEALFVPSGSMGNLIALFLLGGRGKEVLTQKNSHIIHYELSSAATIAGVTPIPVEGDRGILTPAALKPHLRDHGVYYTPRVGLIEVENSHNAEGGTCYSLKQLTALQEFARKQKLPIHMDGARVFNASIATGVPLKKICSTVDSVTFCLSKGLGAPVGSLLCGDTPFIQEAKRIRKMLGGGMRQAGILASAGIWALNNNVERMVEDHEAAKTLANSLSQVEWATIDPTTVETNILYFNTPNHDAPSVVGALAKQGVASAAAGPKQIRLVTSLAVTKEQLKKACETIKGLKI